MIVATVLLILLLYWLLKGSDTPTPPISVPLTDFLEIMSEKLDPRIIEGVTVAHYSIPAFDFGFVKITESGEIKSVKFLVPENCLLISRLNPHIHRVWKVDAHPGEAEIAVGSTEWAVLKPKDPEDLDYLHAILHSYAFRFQFESRVTGTTNSHQRVPREAMQQLLIPLLNKERRREIGSLFQIIKEVSEKNKGANGVVDQPLKELFRSMFLFDKLGLGSYEVADSDLVPTGWRYTNVGDVCTVKRGLSYQGKYLSEEGVAMFNLNSFKRGGGYKASGMKCYKGHYRERHECGPADVLVANTDLTHALDLIGRSIRVPDDVGGPHLFSHHLFRVRINEGENIHPGFLHHWLEAHQPAIARWASGSTVNMLPSAALTRLPLLIPPTGMMEEYGQLAEQVLRLEARRRMASNRATSMIEPALASMLPSDI